MKNEEEVREKHDAPGDEMIMRLRVATDSPHRDSREDINKRVQRRRKLRIETPGESLLSNTDDRNESRVVEPSAGEAPAQPLSRATRRELQKKRRDERN